MYAISVLLPCIGELCITTNNSLIWNEYGRCGKKYGLSIHESDRDVIGVS